MFEFLSRELSELYGNKVISKSCPITIKDNNRIKILKQPQRKGSLYGCFPVYFLYLHYFFNLLCNKLILSRKK